MTASGQGIGLLGGSFNPVHNGHLAIAKSFLKSDFVSELWILLTPDPPHKTENVVNDYEHRLMMLRAVFQQMDKVKVSAVENELPRPSYTIQTLEYLKEQYPETIFYLCIGEDLARNFTEWKDWKKILGHCELLVARRPSEMEMELDLDPAVASKAHFVIHQPVQVSSTEIRDRIAEGKDISGLVPAKVTEIIENENLYRNH